MQHIYFQEWLLIVFNQLLLETYGFEDKARGKKDDCEEEISPRKAASFYIFFIERG